MQLGSYIRSRRKNIGLTQSELAEKVGLTAVTICRYENGERCPSVYDWARICDALGMKMDDYRSDPLAFANSIIVPKIDLSKAMTYEEYAENVGKIEKGE